MAFKSKLGLILNSKLWDLFISFIFDYLKTKWLLEPGIIKYMLGIKEKLEERTKIAYLRLASKQFRVRTDHTICCNWCGDKDERLQVSLSNVSLSNSTCMARTNHLKDKNLKLHISLEFFMNQMCLKSLCQVR